MGKTSQKYKKQVALLLAALPEIAKEKSFALHGGTAINLFVRDMPRLSVDIDLTYIPIENREASLAHIAEALERIKASVEKVIPGVRVQHKKDTGKLQISTREAEIKVEVNLVGRGLLADAVKMPLNEKAQKEFDAFAAIPVVSLGQLYGGKICAALDRQHPRDLFDVKYLLKNEGFSEEVKKGFLLCLLCSDRPMNEVIKPNFQDQRSAMANQFEGMSEEEFSYAEFESIRENLVKIVNSGLTEKDRQFLLSVKNLTPDWSIHDFERFPAVQWKIQNLKKLKETNPRKYQQQYDALKDKLDSDL
jgi:predicted nucleotidyltransferase component of viral defense system